MKKNATGPSQPRPDPSPEPPETRAERREAREAAAEGASGVGSARTISAPKGDLRGLEMHGEWVAPGRARHRRMRIRHVLAVAGGVLLLLVALSAALYLLDARFPWILHPGATATPGPSATAAVPTTEPSETPGGTATPTPAGLDPAARAALFADLQADLAQAAAAMPAGRYAIYYENLANGETWGFHAGDPFVAASCIKMGINTYLYDRVAAGEVSLDEMLTFDKRPYPTGDLEYGTGTIQSQPNGTQYSVRDTARLSIRISDNCGINMILHRLGGVDAVSDAYLSTVGGTVGYRTYVTYKDYRGTTFTSKRGRISADTLGRLAADLYARWVEDPAAYQPLIDDLENTEFKYSIPNLLPEGVAVAHKIGTNGDYDTENDVGIVFASEPFVVCVMTESGSVAKAHAFTSQVARLVYDYVETCATGVKPD